jgi:hypothetical protein
MDVVEKRHPADGRWLLRRRGTSPLDLRISMVPTLYGEDMTIRLLDRDAQLLRLEKLGLPRRDYNQLLALLHNPSGLILAAGPTGSGKTTTLYACLSYLNDGERKIHTIEDPIEYTIEGIRQSQINPPIDVGFAELLRSVLRQAPDVIMIGEIRDPETADIAVRAANSGHLTPPWRPAWSPACSTWAFTRTSWPTARSAPSPSSWCGRSARSASSSSTSPTRPTRSTTSSRCSNRARATACTAPRAVRNAGCSASGGGRASSR